MRRITTALIVSVGLAIALPAHAGRCPNLAILLDRSGSMAADVAGNDPPQNGQKSRWQIAKDALGSLLGTYNGKLPLGFNLYNKGGANNCVTGGFDVQPAYGTRQNIEMTLNNSNPAGNTPTCAAIQSLRAQTPLRDASREQYILLITDGEPNCGASANGYTPPAGCNGGNSNAAQDTAGQITAARNQNPSVKTFVVGFGAGLPATFQANLDLMANAGGVPNMDASFGHAYYPADNEATLLASLSKIISSITGGGDTGGGTVVCDDSCYSIPCTGAGEVCIGGTCKQNPCASVTCSGDQYCYTDGTTGVCVGGCAMSCPAGQRCIQGQCAASPCASACGPSQKCDEGTGVCVDDPACSGILCKPTQGCFGGTCKDDPCRVVSCPSGQSCVPFDGSCVPPDYFTDFCKYTTCDEKSSCDAVLKACVAGGTVGSGCSCDLSESRSRNSALLAPAILLLGMLFLRRRRSTGRLTA